MRFHRGFNGLPLNPLIQHGEGLFSGATVVPGQRLRGAAFIQRTIFGWKDQAFGDGSAGTANSCDRLTRLAMGRIEPAGDDETSAGHGPDIRDLAEYQEAENADPQQLRIRKRRQHRGIGIAETRAPRSTAPPSRRRRSESRT